LSRRLTRGPPTNAARLTPALLLLLLLLILRALIPLFEDLFNKISHSCFNKCVSRKHREPDLALGEMTCTDRCVAKYLEAQQRVGAVLQEANEQQLQQQKSMVDMQQSFGGK
jgi:Tim10/DDP family zinc finger